MFFIDFNQNFEEAGKFLYLFISLIAIAWLVLVWYSYKKYGPKRTIIYFLPIIIATIFVESAGVASGRYVYPGYFIYLSVFNGAVPLIIILGWSVNLFLFMNMGRYVVSKIYQQRNVVQIIFIALAAGLLGLCLDLLEDPIAHHNAWWVWKGSIAGIKFYEVPILNFIGWFVLIFFMALTTLLIERSRFTENRKVLLSITSISVTGTLVFIAHAAITKLFFLAGLV